MRQEDIDRINTLYHKSQSVGLTEVEKAEQDRLRKAYVAAIREILHRHGIPLLVDEAHGAHLGFSPGFPSGASRS